ncbi:hypothetical protein AX16_000747 [Volvariella volvacea WC 439]|nr:hypothetical protein AX16_000747 [Volvariella volvacea WC 439]
MDSSTASSPPQSDSPDVSHPSPRHQNEVVAFIIGLSIILLASILNAAGLNLTKLDHVRTSTVPKSARKRDWMRPLWLLGMLLYILSQLIGSTLALEYMRAEYVAPLGSSSLVFNFLFARFLVGTPVTINDIYGTVIVVLGVIGIVAFGSINSGLASETDVERLTYLWRRSGWLGYFFLMSGALFLLLIFTYRLDAILVARNDLSSTPGSTERLPTSNPLNGLPSRSPHPVIGVYLRIQRAWSTVMRWVTDKLEVWSAPKDDKQIAWTLGIGWACAGGGLAGGCLVFAKVIVKLLSGALSHENTGNQFGRAAPIFTIILLSITAVFQILCLNRGLKVYDSTLVVPVFYGVYTATGFLNSLIFNDEVDSYQTWTLFLIFVSIFILISGVVLLTHKKPDPVSSTNKSIALSRPRRKSKTGSNGKGADVDVEGGEDENAGEQTVLWTVGEASDDEDDQGEDEDIDHHQNPRNQRSPARPHTYRETQSKVDRREETQGLFVVDDEDDDADDVNCNSSQIQIDGDK